MNPYTPRPGSMVELAVNLLASEGEQNRARLASEMGCEQKNLEAHLKAAIDSGFIIKFKDETGQTKWTLAELPDYPEPPTQPAPAPFPEQKYHVDLMEDETHDDKAFACAIWSTGELEICQDGEIIATLRPDEILKLRKFLHSFTVPTTL